MIPCSLKGTFRTVRQMCFVVVVCSTFAVSGCSIMGSESGPESAERTLPGAFDVRRVALTDARRTVPAPDTVNVEAYVIELAICPENANCLLPDGIVIAERREPDEEGKTRRITVESPRQFVVGRRYLISLRVTDPSDRNLDENLLGIVGYSRIE